MKVEAAIFSETSIPSYLTSLCQSQDTFILLFTSLSSHVKYKAILGPVTLKLSFTASGVNEKVTVLFSDRQQYRSLKSWVPCVCNLCPGYHMDHRGECDDYVWQTVKYEKESGRDFLKVAIRHSPRAKTMRNAFPGRDPNQLFTDSKPDALPYR
jgi:hypothetical protein